MSEDRFWATWQNGSEKKCIFLTFLSAKQCTILPTSQRTDFREIFTQNVNRHRREFFGTELPNSSDKGSFIPVISFWVFWYTYGEHTPALAFRSGANLSIASYSWRVKGVFSLVTFFIQLNIFWDVSVRNHPKFWELHEILLYFGCRYSVGSLVMDLHMWQIGGSNGRVALTVTSDDFDLFLWTWKHLNSGLRLRSFACQWLQRF